MSMQKRIGIGIGIVVLLVLIFFIKKRASAPPPNLLIEETARRKGPCPGEVKTIESEGKKYKLTSNWYACKPQVNGDLVLYRYSFSREPVVRRIVAIPGEEFAVKKDETHHLYNLSVNHKLVEDADKKPHFFGNAVKEPVLSLYTKNGEGKLVGTQSIVFSDTSPGVYDSGMFGVVNSDDFLGKIELAP